LIGLAVLVRSTVLKRTALLGRASVRGRPARPVVVLTRAAIFERSLLELLGTATARSAGWAPGPTAGGGVAGVLGRFLVPGQEQANRVRNDRSQTLIV
jgi:hypothetical protein